MNKRIGKFSVSDNIIESENGHKLFSYLEFVPLRVIVGGDHYSYIGYSKYFDEIEKVASISFHCIPEYVISVQKHPMSLDYVFHVMNPEEIIDMDYAEIERRVLADEEQCMLYDPHQDRAAIHFGIDIKYVTDAQRQVGKALNYKDMYSGKGSITGRFIDSKPDIQEIKSSKSKD